MALSEELLCPDTHIFEVSKFIVQFGWNQYSSAIDLRRPDFYWDIILDSLRNQKLFNEISLLKYVNAVNILLTSRISITSKAFLVRKHLVSLITNQLLQKGVQEKALLTNALYFLQAIRKCPFTQQVLCRNTLESHLLPVNSLRMEFLFNNPFYERNMVDKMAPFGITEIPYFDFYHHYQLFELLIWDPISKGQSLSTLFPLISTFITANPIVIFTKCSPIQSEFSLLEFIVLTAPDSAVFNNKIIATFRNAMKILGDQFTLEEYQTLSNALNAAVLVQRNAILPGLLDLISPFCSVLLPKSRSPLQLFFYAIYFPNGK